MKNRMKYAGIFAAVALLFAASVRTTVRAEEEPLYPYEKSYSAVLVGDLTTPGTRNSQHINDYITGNLKENFKYLSPDYSGWVEFSDYVGELKRSIPLPASWPDELDACIDANGVLRYKCATCGRYGYCIDAQVYGCYDSKGRLVVSGWRSELIYCDGCTPCEYEEYRQGVTVGNIGQEGSSPILNEELLEEPDTLVVENGVVVGFLPPPESSYRLPTEEDATYVPGKYYDGGTSSVVSEGGNGGYGFKGIYVHPGIEDWAHQGRAGLTIQPDPGIKETRHENEVMAEIASKVGQTLNGETGRYIQKTMEDGEEHFGVEIMDKKSNGVPDSAPFGYHFYNAYHEYVNLGEWMYWAYSGCIHIWNNPLDAFYYIGKGIGAGADQSATNYGVSIAPTKCLKPYPTGAHGYCADCGKQVEVGLFYSTPETLSVIRRVKNGTSYIFLCPNHSAIHSRPTSINLSGREFKYLNGIVDNECDITHACREVGLNQYVLLFESNSPDPAFFPNYSYTESGYFYDVFDERQVPYVSEGTELAYNPSSLYTLDNGRKVYGSPSIVKSKNEIPAPKFNSRGYIFDGWLLWNGTDWVPVGKTPTWEEIFVKLGSTNNNLAFDMAIIKLKATWITPSTALH